jgi:serine/threonine-protein kinase HipA
MRELNIYVDQNLVGTLSEDNNLWVLDYDPAWAARDDSFDLSPALPRTTLRHLDGATLRPVQWYFDNLLPEEELRRVAAKDAGLKDHEDAFALLQYLGAESAGSLTLLPPGMPLPQERALQPLGYPDLSKRIQQLPRSSLSRQAPKRMSVAGAQHKLLAVMKGADIYEPVGATPSTHILKPDHPNAQTYPASAFLERLTMRMADAAGLTVPQVGLLEMPEPVYVIERFDRKMDAPLMRPETGAQAPDVKRLHIIDACQLLNKSRLFKHSGATVEALREAIERTGDTLALPQRVFRWLVFNLLVANDDCHLKNLSFIVQANTITLAPHYDLLATGVYHTGSFAGADARWPDVEMTIPLAGRVTRFGDVTPEAVLAAATTLGVPQTVALRVVREVVTRTYRYFDRIYAEHYAEEPGLFATLHALHGEVEALDLVDAQPEPAVQGDVSPAARQLGLHRRILRVLRYIVLPEMGRRISATARGNAVPD